MRDSNQDLVDLLPRLTADAARELGRAQQAQGEELLRRAKALFAYAEALEDVHSARDSGDISDTAGKFVRGPVEHVDVSDSATASPSDPPGGRALPAAPPSNKRPLIMRLVEESPLPGWNPARVHAELVRRGEVPPETTKASIGVTLRRMYARYGDLARTRDGLYTTAEHGTLFADSPEGRGDTHSQASLDAE